MENEFKSERELAIAEMVLDIEQADLNEIKAINAYRAESDPDMKESHREDAYLCALIQVREGRLLGKKAYDAEKIEAVTGMTHEALFIPEYEDYNIE